MVSTRREPLWTTAAPGFVSREAGLEGLTTCFS
ncbi:hypothetical protein NOCARDAX2BIS_120057 [Nocardioides sp. AX2bis]|nr:hypothetical protein NOCARDAX2BIS_120057 [Nocardioides sp. AX2bis]